MRIAIYIPTDIDEISAYVEGIAQRLSETFGGCTIVPNCRGFWISKENKLLKDKIAIAIAYTSDSFDTHPANYRRLINIVFDIKRDLKQESVAYTIDNQIYFV